MPMTAQRAPLGEPADSPGFAASPEPAADPEAAAEAAGSDAAAAPGTAAGSEAATNPEAATNSEAATNPDSGTATNSEAATDSGTPTDSGTAAGPEGKAGEPAATRRSLRVPALLGLATVLLGGFGVWATVTAHDLRASSAGQNAALVDAAATSAVKHQVSSAVDTIFSYRYTGTAATRRSAQRLLTGPAIRQYDQLFSLVQREAPAQKLVVTTTVTNSGVEFLAGGRARVLIFANQQDTRAGTGQTSYAGAMFAVTAIRAGGIWKIENIDTFTSG